MNPMRLASLLASVVAVSSCAGPATAPVTVGVGPNPQLPPPQTPLIPAVPVAPGVGCPAVVVPPAAPGTRVTALARGLDHPRWVYVLPNGDVLVAESNKPALAPDQEPKGVRAWVMKTMTKRAGAGVPSADRITLLRDSDGDGVAETKSVFIEN